MKMILKNKQNWMTAERESNLFPRVMIIDGIGRHKVLLQTYLKIAVYHFRKCLKNCFCGSKLNFVLTTVPLR